MKPAERYSREYLGVTITRENYKDILKKEGRKGINFHAKHLRAYLKGWQSFSYGRQWNSFWAKWEPVFHPVKQRMIQL
jgi:hypothetical protein